MVTFVGGSGHLNPMVPLVRAAAAAGHDVRFAVMPSMVRAVRALGFPVFPLDDGPPRPPRRLPGRDPDDAYERKVFRDEFVLAGTRLLLPRVEAVCGRWRPDLIMVDDTNIGGMLAAERLGIPHVTVQVLAPDSFVRPTVIGDVVAEVRAEFGLPPDPDLEFVARHLMPTPFPPSYATRRPATARPFRGDAPLPRRGARPPWAGTRTVYFTLGTIYNMECGDLFARVLGGLAQVPAHSVVTVGEHIDPAEFGRRPAHVHLERFVPQATLLPWCDLVVSHGGSGSVVGTLTHGLPSVLLPLGADQPYNAARLTALGAAVTLDPVTLTPDSLAAAVHRALEDPGPREAAGRLAAEIAAQPTAAELVPLLEAVAHSPALP